MAHDETSGQTETTTEETAQESVEATAPEKGEEKPAEKEVVNAGETQDDGEPSLTGRAPKKAEKTPEEELPKDPAERLKKLEEERSLYTKDRESYEKQVKDLRRIISKGKAPEDLKEYASYKPDSVYEEEYKSEKVQELASEIDALSHNLGLNLEVNAQLKDFYNKHFLDGRTPEQKRLAKKEWIESEKKKLGENADEVIEDAKGYIANTQLFSPQEKEALLGSMDKGALWVSIVNKLNKISNPRNKSIPTTPPDAGGADVEALAKEYRNNETTQHRRLEILKYMRQHGMKMPF